MVSDQTFARHGWYQRSGLSLDLSPKMETCKYIACKYMGLSQNGGGTPKYIYYINMRCILVFRSRGARRARRACGARGEVEPVGPVEGQ